MDALAKAREIAARLSGSVGGGSDLGKRKNRWDDDGGGGGGSSYGPGSSTEVPTDPTAYYNDYWTYASYYGEAAARLYYGAWSPPEGTPPPAGVVVAPDSAAAAAAATTATATGTADASGAATVAASTDATSNGETPSKAQKTESSDKTTAAEDPEAAWEAYKKQYAEWYEAYGKAAGADPNPLTLGGVKKKSMSLTDDEAYILVHIDKIKDIEKKWKVHALIREKSDGGLRTLILEGKYADILDAQLELLMVLRHHKLDGPPDTIRQPDSPLDQLDADFDGINGWDYPRDNLVKDLYNLVVSTVGRFVHIGAPAGSGKTSLLQLFKACYVKVDCIYVSMFNYRENLINQAGINPDSWSLIDSSPCHDPHRLHVILLDDAQAQYSNHDLWASLIKNASVSRLPKNVKFVISATYSLKIPGSPVDFALLPKLDRKCLKLTDGEVIGIINMYCKQLKSSELRAVFADADIITMLAVHCCGNIGTLTVSIKSIINHFRGASPSVDEVVSFYLSQDMMDRFSRCFMWSGTLPEPLRDALISCLTKGPSKVPDNSEEYGQLIRCGVLEMTMGGVMFTSPAASAYINNALFPSRSMMMVDQVRANGLVALMKGVIGKMHANTLRKSFLDAKKGSPSEATYQHAMLSGLEAMTPSECYICPELSKYFPEQRQPIITANKSVYLGATSRLNGRLDFYINGLQWAIEALVNGDGITEQMARLEGDGKYTGLSYHDYIVVDFRVNETGKVTNVHRHEKRLSVYFTHDFSFCNVVYGTSGEPEKIDL